MLGIVVLSGLSLVAFIGAYAVEIINSRRANRALARAIARKYRNPSNE